MIYGYLRVSTDDQDCDNQKRGVLGLAEQRGLTVDKWIVDDRKLKTKERKNLFEILSRT